jgi:hypothetical protein
MMFELLPDVMDRFPNSSNRRAHLHESDRTLRDGSFGVALFQALRARQRSHRPSGTFHNRLWLTRINPGAEWREDKESLCCFSAAEAEGWTYRAILLGSRGKAGRLCLEFGHLQKSRPEFAPRRGWRAQPRVSTLGTDQPTRRALKGRQIERPNKVEIGVPMAQL